MINLLAIAIWLYRGSDKKWEAPHEAKGRLGLLRNVGKQVKMKAEPR